MKDSLSTQEVKNLFNKQKRIKGKDFSLLIGSEGGAPFRFAVIPAGCKGANKRNAVRRKVREAVRALRKVLPAGKTCALITSEKILFKKPQEVKDAVEKIFKENELL